MKIFLGFGGKAYYSSGGLADLICAKPSLEEAMAAITTAAETNRTEDGRFVRIQWAHIVDIETGDLYEHKDFDIGGHEGPTGFDDLIDQADMLARAVERASIDAATGPAKLRSPPRRL